MVLAFTVQEVAAQLPKKFFADPSAQIRQLIQLPRLDMPSIKMPKLPDLANRPVMPGYNIKKAIEDAEERCPLLNAKSTILLDGQRTSDEQVGLEWKTTNAYYSDAFDIERSLGDTLHFEKVNFVWAKGNKAKEKYQLPDNNDYSELSYYRIRMVMMDGSSRYSNIAAVRGYGILSLYPNPSSANVSIILSSKVQGTGKISITDGAGKTVQQYSSPIIEGYNQKDLDIARLSAGVYIITVTLPDKQMRVRKLIKN